MPKIVIDINDSDYKDIQKYGTVLDEDRDDIADAIKNGTLLPDNHGRLIDADVFINEVVKYSYQSTKTIGTALADTPTILGAKRGE